MARCRVIGPLTRLVLVCCCVTIVKPNDCLYQKSCRNRQDAEFIIGKRIALGSWDQANEDLAFIDTNISPDNWNLSLYMLHQVNPQVPANGAETLNHLVKVTDRKHRFPVLATVCSLTFLATVVALIVICTS